MRKLSGTAMAGLCAGAINGLLGAGGGMILVPLLCRSRKLKEQEIFPASVCIILPICVVSLILSLPAENIGEELLIPYLTGSAAGGLLAGCFGQQIPTKWLHRLLGALILWGGIRYLW